MKKPSSKIWEEIARLQDQLRQAETREAERIGRIALRAGLGEIEIEEATTVAVVSPAVLPSPAFLFPVACPLPLRKRPAISSNAA
ncbi:hypothetical protein GCM10010869_21350 [Mesorhizobium tianshanense]|uniref:TraC-like protein n=1 Tax=Mesorhizobium tianshanense TaxID=39844 RepID=A0A562MQU1_9HYPH|nr:TraC family protein [Mesorhizobium tianshanense]TWI22283.1 TraC-like protein [Mesorhizobium tianshanense]GLS36546.1 hypothetical protein GCM10010869_21350 [Mesorhizobium tianshanense]